MAVAGLGNIGGHSVSHRSSPSSYFLRGVPGMARELRSGACLPPNAYHVEVKGGDLGTRMEETE